MSAASSGEAAWVICAYSWLVWRLCLGLPIDALLLRRIVPGWLPGMGESITHVPGRGAGRQTRLVWAKHARGPKQRATTGHHSRIDNLSEAEEDMRRKMMEVLLRQRTRFWRCYRHCPFHPNHGGLLPTNASQTGNNTLQQTYLPTVAKENGRHLPDVVQWVYQLTNYQNDRLGPDSRPNFALAVVDLGAMGRQIISRRPK